MTAALEELTAALAARRADAGEAARADYRALVLRLAAGKPSKHDTPAVAEQLLARVGRDERALRADVAQVVAYRQAVAEAGTLPALEADLAAASEAEAAAREALERETARLEAEVTAAVDRRVAAQQRAQQARKALERVVAAAPTDVVERYREAQRALSRAAGAIEEARRPDAAERPLPAPFREALEAVPDDEQGTPLARLRDALKAVREASRALWAHNNNGKYLPSEEAAAEDMAERRSLEAAVAERRAELAAALRDVADAGEPEVEELRADLAAATEELLNADPRVEGVTS